MLNNMINYIHESECDYIGQLPYLRDFSISWLSTRCGFDITLGWLQGLIVGLFIANVFSIAVCIDIITVFNALTVE